MARPSNQNYFGIRIFEVEKFIMSMISLLGFVITITFFATKIYLRQEFSEELNKKDKDCQSQNFSLQVKIEALENTSKYVTKEELAAFSDNLKRSSSDGK